MRTIKSIDEKHMLEALDFVEKVFTEYENETEGELEYSFYETLR